MIEHVVNWDTEDPSNLERHFERWRVATLLNSGVCCTTTN